MKRHLIAWRPVALVLVLAFAASAALADDSSTSQTRAQELSSLQQAYNQLKYADKDYAGHRAKAMRAIETAAKDIGGKAGARHRGREAQSSSDAQMRHAETLLQSVSDTASAKGQEHLSKHVSKALAEIHTALALK